MPAARTLSPLIDATDVAARIGESERRVYKLTSEGVFDGCLVRLGRRLKYDPDRLERLLERGGRALPGGWRREPTPEHAKP